MKAPVLTEDQKTHWEEQGYVIVRNAIAKESIAAMNQAIDQIIERATRGDFEDRFHWIDESAGVPHFISDLLSPEKYDPSLGHFLNDAAIPLIENLLAKPVRCSWLMLLTGGGGYPYSLALHRDNAPLGGDEEREALTNFRSRQSYFQAPLLSDSSLGIVPESHLRIATEEELEAVKLSAEGSQPVTGLIRIELEPGDIIFRHTNTIHDGYNPEGLPRRTLVSSMWAEEMPLLDIEQQDHRNLEDKGFVEKLPERLRESVQRYLTANAAASNLT